MDPKSDDTEYSMELLSSPSSSITEQVNEMQKSRSKARLNPLSSSPTPSRTRTSEFHHVTNQEQARRFSTTNPRNKHNRIRQVRNQHRYEKLSLQREGISDKQYKQDVEREYAEQVREYVESEHIDRLVEDERELLSENERSGFDMQEAEERAWEEEMELMELIGSLNLGSG
ncbi:hypothetical protein KGF57_002085 [Candida theae]|uniref:Uncharacterized protein n=1 Tax=Candida theae TaxID=1198502 RepID=A0AAD5FZB0_9ASCO|nr:uncharacterized protein KGF57_002085 [Candida theae]KAI5959447.1 hypothetical protein KGF57_002085 [Candida theae]